MSNAYSLQELKDRIGRDIAIIPHELCSVRRVL